MAVTRKGGGLLNLLHPSSTSVDYTLSSSRNHPHQGPVKNLYLERGKMTRMTKLLLMAAVLIAASFAASSPAPAQQGYGPPPDHLLLQQRQRPCNVGGSTCSPRRQSGFPAQRTWCVTGAAIWVDRGPPVIRPGRSPRGHSRLHLSSNEAEPGAVEPSMLASSGRPRLARARVSLS